MGLLMGLGCAKLSRLAALAVDLTATFRSIVPLIPPFLMLIGIETLFRIYTVTLMLLGIENLYFRIVSVGL